MKSTSPAEHKTGNQIILEAINMLVDVADKHKHKWTAEECAIHERALGCLGVSKEDEPKPGEAVAA